MVEIYGQKWVINYSKADSGTWLDGLRGLTLGLIVNGLRKCINRPDPWPPSLPEFRSICLGNVDKETAVQQAMQNHDTAIARKLRSLLTSYDWNNRTTYELTKMLCGLYPQAIDENTVSVLTHQYQKLLEAS